MYTRFAAFLEGGMDGFDAAAFRLPRTEAVALDPQARLLLEHSWVHSLVSYTLLQNAFPWCAVLWQIDADDYG